MNNFEYIKSLSKKELAQFLIEISNGDCTPWDEWFGKNYCKCCDGVIESGMEYSFCELNDYCCKFGRDMFDDANTALVWFEQEHKI